MPLASASGTSRRCGSTRRASLADAAPKSSCHGALLQKLQQQHSLPLIGPGVHFIAWGGSGLVAAVAHGVVSVGMARLVGLYQADVRGVYGIRAMACHGVKCQQIVRPSADS